LKETYPAIETKLTDMLQRIAEADKEVARINGSAPDGVPLRLREVELAARDFEGFTTAAPPIAQELKLPHWEQPSTLAWPPPRSFDPTSFTPVPFVANPYWVGHATKIGPHVFVHSNYRRFNSRPGVLVRPLAQSVSSQVRCRGLHDLA